MSATRKVHIGDESILGAAYCAASYYVDGPAGRFVLRIGANIADVDRLAAAHEVNAWAYITAYNPGSVATPRERNEARQQELEHAVAEAKYRFSRGESQADDGAWEAEPSLLIFGIGEPEAAMLGRRFQQAAIVYGERGGPARLVWTYGESS